MAARKARNWRKPKNADVRPREYLTDSEVNRLMKAAAKSGRHGHRDSTLILVTYRHGLRVSELVALLWDQVELDVLSGIRDDTVLSHRPKRSVGPRCYPWCFFLIPLMAARTH